MTLQHNFLAIDEGRQRMSLIDTRDRTAGWTISLADYPLARDMQRLAPDRVLVGYDHGFFELQIATGAIDRVCAQWTEVTSVHRLADGRTLVTGHRLDGGDGVNVLTLDAQHRLQHTARRDGDYVRLMRSTPDGSYLLCSNDHILETDQALTALRALRAPSFEHAWLAQRQADGSTLVSAGYGAFMARFNPQGQLIGTFGRATEVPAEVAPFFYATFQVLEDGRILVANWQGHGEDNGAKGRQLLEFSASGVLLGSWSDAEKISSLQGLLIV